MSITNELSSEVAAALLSNREPGEAQELLHVLNVFHSALQDLSAVERELRRSKASGRLPATPRKGALPGAH